VIADTGTMQTGGRIRSVNKIEMAGFATTRARTVDPAPAAGANRTFEQPNLRDDDEIVIRPGKAAF
jgi:hypothetical protein